MSDTAITIPCHIRTVRGLDQPRVFIHDGRVVASSEDVAAFFGKRHNNVIRDIRSLISNDKACALNFEQTYRDMKMPMGGTRRVAVYNMTRDGLTLLAMGFTGKRALGWKLKYIEAFNRMEAELAKPRQVFDDEPGVKSQLSLAKLPRAELCLKQHPIDMMDTAIDLVKAVESAIMSDKGLSFDELISMGNVLGHALKMFRPVRELIDRAA